MRATTLRAVLVMFACLLFGQAQTFNPPTREQFNAAGARPYQRFHAPDGPLKCEPIPANSPSYSDARVKAALEAPITHFGMPGAIAKIEFPGQAICTGTLDNAKLKEIKDEGGKSRLFMDHCSVDDKEWSNWVEITTPPPSTPPSAPALNGLTLNINQGQGQQGTQSEVELLLKMKLIQMLENKPTQAAPTLNVDALVDGQKRQSDLMEQLNRIEQEKLAVEKGMWGSLKWANRINGVNAGLNLGQLIVGAVTMNRVGETNNILENGFKDLGQQIAKQPPMAITLTQMVGDVTSGSNPSVNNSTPTNIQNGQSQGQQSQTTANPQANGGAITGSGNSQTTANGGAGGSGAMNPVLQGGQGGNGGSGGIGLGGFGGGGEGGSSNSTSGSSSSGTTTSGANSTGASANSTGATATTGPSSSSSGSQAGATTGTVTANGTGNGGQAITGPVTSGSQSGANSGSNSGAAAGATNAPSTTNNNSSGSLSGAGANSGSNSGAAATGTGTGTNNPPTTPPTGGGGN